MVGEGDVPFDPSPFDVWTPMATRIVVDHASSAPG